MTTFQIKVAVATRKFGSISAAAKELDISQPNASNCLKALEAEIGFPIFDRTKSGATLTEKGFLFLEHAKNILQENDIIMDLQNHEEVYRLRLGTANYTAALRAFARLCNEHRDDAEADFRYYSVSIFDGIKELENYGIDFLFAPALKSQYAGVHEMCKKHNLAMISIGELPAVINVRKDHPAALDGRCQNITQGSDALKEFPYVSYRNLFSDSTATGYKDSDFVQCSYKIYVDEAEARHRVVAATNGFAFGIQPSRGVNERYGIVSFPVPGIMMELFCLTRSTDRERKEIHDYIKLLKEEMEL